MLEQRCDVVVVVVVVVAAAAAAASMITVREEAPVASHRTDSGPESNFRT
jgi:hypothetical protein